MINLIIAQTMTAAVVVDGPADLQVEITKLIIGAVATILALIIQEIRFRLQRAAAERARAVACALVAGVEAVRPELAATTKRAIKTTSEILGVAEEVRKIVEETVHKKKPHTRKGN